MHGQTRRLQRRRERRKSGGGSGGKRRARGGRSGAGAGAGSRLVKAAPSGEIAARIAELHKTLSARPAATPAPISRLIAARAGYAFKCYLIGLRRSWGPERPPPPPRTRRAQGLLPPPQICIPSHRLQSTPSLPPPPARRLPSAFGVLLLFPPPKRSQRTLRKTQVPGRCVKRQGLHKKTPDAQRPNGSKNGSH